MEIQKPQKEKPKTNFLLRFLKAGFPSLKQIQPNDQMALVDFWPNP